MESGRKLVAMTYEDMDGRHGRCGRKRHGNRCGGGLARGPLSRARRAVRRRTRFQRDSENALLAGVCAGIANHLNVRLKWVRIAAVISLFVFTFPTVLAYGLIAWLAPSNRDLEGVGEDPVTREPAFDDAADKGAAFADEALGAAEGLARLKTKFRYLEEKFADVEAQVMGDRTA